MARYKHIDTSPKFIPVDLVAQLLPGTFEHALCHLIDHEVDLSRFDARYRNDVEETKRSKQRGQRRVHFAKFAFRRQLVLATRR